MGCWSDEQQRQQTNNGSIEMHKINNTLFRHFASSVITYFLIAATASFVCWSIIMGIVIHIDSIPKTIRQGYENTYLSMFGIYLLFLLPVLILYKLTNLFNRNNNWPMKVKIITGLFFGFLPFSIGLMLTWGIPSPSESVGEWVVITTLTLAGGCIPILEKRIGNLLET